jgi:hypothetical protein
VVVAVPLTHGLASIDDLAIEDLQGCGHTSLLTERGYRRTTAKTDPRSLGGSNEMAKLLPARRSCNGRRGNDVKAALRWQSGNSGTTST